MTMHPIAFICTSHSCEQRPRIISTFLFYFLFCSDRNPFMRGAYVARCDHCERNNSMFYCTCIGISRSKPPTRRYGLNALSASDIDFIYGRRCSAISLSIYWYTTYVSYVPFSAYFVQIRKSRFVRFLWFVRGPITIEIKNGLRHYYYYYRI